MNPSTDPAATAFFDIGDTLASVTVAASGDRIERLAVYPYVPAVLEQLRDRGVRLGIISNRGPIPAEDVNRALRDCGLWDFFVPELVTYGRKDSPAIFQRAATAAGPTEQLMFVGEDATERAHARTAGFQVAPHPLLAAALLERPAPALRYVRVTGPQAPAGTDPTSAFDDLPLVPVHVTGAGGGTIYAITTAAGAARLDDLGFWVDRLGAPDEPLTTDLYLLRDDRQRSSGFLTADGNSAAFFEDGPAAHGVLASTGEGLLVAVPAGTQVGRYHFGDARHGHNLKLTPSADLLSSSTDRAGPVPMARTDAATITPA